MKAFLFALFPLAGYLLAIGLLGLSWLLARVRGGPPHE